MWFTHKNNIVWCLVGGDNNIFVMEERPVFSNIWVLKDWCKCLERRLFLLFLDTGVQHDFQLSWCSMSSNSNTTSATQWAGTAHSSGATEFTPGFSGVRVVRLLVFCIMFCLSLFVLLTIVLSVLPRLRFLLTILVYSDLSQKVR